jgi:hypothetical protein
VFHLGNPPKGSTHQICSCQPLENGAMNCDPESVGGDYPKTCVWPTLHGMEIPPWLDQCLDLVY